MKEMTKNGQTLAAVSLTLISFLLIFLVLAASLIKPCDVQCQQEMTTSTFYGNPVVMGHTNDFITSLDRGDLMWWENHLYIITEKHILVEFNLTDGIQDFIDTSTGRYMDYDMITDNWFAENDLTLITCIGFSPDPLGRFVIIAKRLI